MSSCKSSTSINVKDGSNLSSSRKEFFANLEKVYKEKTSNIDSYYSKKVSISSNDIPMYSSVNSTVYLKGDSAFFAKIFLPFPVVEVGRLKVVGNRVSIKSKQANIDVVNNLPAFTNQIIRSTFLGVVPDVSKLFGEQNYNNFEVFIENEKYVMYRKSGNYILNIYVNSDYTLSSISFKSGNTSMTFNCGSYTRVDNYELPSSFDITSNMNNRVFRAEISVKNILLNSSNTLSF